MKRRLAFILLTALVSIFGAVKCGGEAEEEPGVDEQERQQPVQQEQEPLEPESSEPMPGAPRDGTVGDDVR